MPRNNTDPVTLPAAAKHMAHDSDGKFVFSDTNAHIPPQQIEPLEHVTA